MTGCKIGATGCLVPALDREIRDGFGAKDLEALSNQTCTEIELEACEWLRVKRRPDDA